MGCESSWYFWCVPSAGSSCGGIEGYGHLIPGQCQLYVSEVHNQNCVENALQTAVLMRYHRSECQFYDGACQCMWILGGSGYPPTSLPACDCMTYDE
jgi:hypothetical protein